MKKALSLLLVMAMLLTGMTVVLSSCSDEPDDPGADIHLFLSSRLYDLDPTLAIVDDDAAQILSLLYEPLFRLKADGSVEGALAKSYKINKEDRTMTIKLRKTYWSNAELVTSYDVLYAWGRLLSFDFENPAAALLYDIENAYYIKQGGYPDDYADETLAGETLTEADLGVQAPDDSTLIITFRSDVEYIDYDEFLRNLTSVSLSPVPSDIVSNSTSSDNWAKRVATIATNGPFTLSAMDYSSGEFTLQRNQYYRRSKNASDSTLADYVTPQFLTTAWQTSNMTVEQYEEFIEDNIILHFADEEGQENLRDSFYFIGEIPVALRGNSKYADKIVTNDLLSVSTCVFNMAKDSNPALANKYIRQALSEIIDRTALANELVYAKPATGMVTPGVYEPGTKNDFRTTDNALLAVTASQSKAEDLLAKGMAELNYTSKDQLGELRIVYSGDNINDAYTANYLKSAWEKLGFTVVLDAVYGNQRMINEDILVLDSVLQTGFNSGWKDCRVEEVATEAPTEAPTEAESATTEAPSEAPTLEEGTVEEGATDEEGGVQEPAMRRADVLLIDYQMQATNAYATLAGFATSTSGNGANKYANYTSVPHVSGYSDEAYDKLIAEAYAASDAATRAAKLHEAEAMLLDAMPVVPLLFNQDYYMISDKLSNIKTSAYGMPVFTKVNQKGYKDLLLYNEEEVSE